MKIILVNSVCYGRGELLLLINVRCLVGMFEKLKLMVNSVSIIIIMVMVSNKMLE